MVWYKVWYRVGTIGLVQVVQAQRRLRGAAPHARALVPGQAAIARRAQLRMRGVGARWQAG